MSDDGWKAVVSKDVLLMVKEIDCVSDFGT